MGRTRAGGSGESERFPKHRRLRKRREYLAVQQGGRKIHLSDVLVLFSPRRGCSRLGVTVSRKVGNAVQRNRIKRLVREVWRRNRVLFPEGIDMVVIAKRSAGMTTYARLSSQLMELARRVSHGLGGR